MSGPTIERSPSASRPAREDATEVLAELELVHQGARHRLYRADRYGRRVIVKQLGSAARDAVTVASLRHEYEVLRALDVPGVVKAYDLTPSDGGLALVMDDAGDTNLAGRVRAAALTVDEFLDVATQLTAIIQRLHAAHVVHRNISPSNVVWDSTSHKATLIDFTMATTLATLTVESTSPSEMEGDLSYISPEQSGRTGRAVDSRADLYSLGATFYELLTGVPPFQAQDPIEVIHAHLAKRPQPLHERNAAVPRTISEMVLTLLEKEPERRYQTAEGLLADLRTAANHWASTGAILSFPLRTHDGPRALQFSDKLYGRDAEVAVLLDAFERACMGPPEFVLVIGTPGIGKSALVTQLERPVVARRGIFLVGKFDQLQRGVPYSALVQAFRRLVRHLLAQPEPALERWREGIQGAVSPNGQVLLDVIPELQRVIGPQPPPPKLGPEEAKNRLHRVFTAFLRVIARAEHPLVLFLDDLQWVDAASLRLIEQWTGDADNRHLLLVGAYRDTEVDAAHPFALSLDAMRKKGTDVHEVRPGALGQGDVAQLIAESFNQEVGRASALARLVTTRTGGNPFFVRRLLHTLHGDGLIRFASQRRAWEWRLEEIERAPLSDNVLDLMVRSIARLPEPTKVLLEAGACIGHSFDLATLSEVSGRSRADATNRLWPAFEDGLLIPIRETYKAPRSPGPLDEHLDDLPGHVQFVHDRVQQAAYSFLSREERMRLHLRIGRRLLASIPDDKLDEKLFDIVDQLDRGEALVADAAERRRLAELNLAAGRKAKLSAAYQAAYDYLGLGMRHLPSHAWEEAPELTFAIHRELAECAYLTARHDEADRLTKTAIARAPSNLAKMNLYSLRATAECVIGNFAQALRAGHEGLSLFGQAWPLEGLPQAIESEAGAVMVNLAGRDIQALAEAPELDDEEVSSCIKLLSLLGPPAYFFDSQVLAFVVTRITNLSLRHGPSPYSAYGYTFYGALHNQRTGDYDTGFAFGRLALALARRFGNRGELGRSLQVFGLIVNPWKAHLRTTLPLFREGYQASLESGELQYVALNLVAILIHAFPLGTALAEFEKDVEVSLEASRKLGNTTAEEFTLVYRQAVRWLTGRTHSPGSFDPEELTGARFLDETRDPLTPAAFYWIVRMQVQYLVGDLGGAKESAARAKRALPLAMGMMIEAEYAFYLALTTAALHRRSPDPALLPELRALHGKLANWADHCPENFRHKEQLVAAEIARVEGDPGNAATLYRASFEQAGREQFTQDKALVAERFAELLLVEGDGISAAAYLREARNGYLMWGASAKVHRLEQAYPNVFSASHVQSSPLQKATPIDALGLIKASQAISAETVPEQLFQRILQIAIEVAGAEGATLLLKGPDGLVARGRVTANEEALRSAGAVGGRVALAASVDLPQAIVRYVARLQEPLVLADAAREGLFASDAQVQRLHLRSVLCVPLKRLADQVGVLYLENRAMAGVFTDDRVQVVQVLAAQAAISLDNATLYDDAQRAIQIRDEFLSIASHELKTPLTSIQLQSQVIKRRLAKGDASALSPEALVKLVEQTDRQTARLARLVDEMLDVSRINAGRFTLYMERHDLATLVRETADRCELVISQAGSKVTVDTPGPIMCQLDTFRMEQVVLNLLTNAARYGEGKPIEVTVRAEPGGCAEIAVRDHGRGIAGDNQSRIFERFERATSMNESSALGLGLYIAREIVQGHGGTIRVESELGRGATFLVRIPRGDDDECSFTE
jgi:predicted ATPase/signal transduction histidine kinase/tRNA A-37 threonylcarbamoyl transferase component Bud32